MSGLDYIPGLIAAYEAGFATDHVHLGYWPEGRDLDWAAAQDAMTQLHLALLDPSEGQSVVDIGCGLGSSLRVLDGMLQDSLLTGVNIDGRQLAICARLASQKNNTFDWVEADATATGLPAETFDRALSLEAMFHFPSRAAFFAEMHRILRPGGLLVCSDILFAKPENDDEAAWLELVVRGYAPWPDPITDQAQVSTLAQDAGLVVLSTQDITDATTPTWAQIVSSKDGPLSSPQAAMKALHHAGRLQYVVSVLQKPRG